MTNIVPLRPRHGASPAEWTHFLFLLGPDDLLPVVSNPNAKIAPDSTIKDPGKVPSWYNARGEMVGIARWTSRVSTPEHVDTWASNSDYGICIQTREVRGIDIDLDEPAQAEAVLSVAMRHFPDAAVRRRTDSARVLVAIRVKGEQPKRRIKTEGGAVEMLGNGQHFVAVGHHPKGGRYVWDGGLPLAIPEYPPEALDTFWAEVMATFGLEQSEQMVQGRKGEDLEIEDEVVDWIEAHWPNHGFSNGKIFVECPWKEEHSKDSGPTETAWLAAGSRGYQQGHFECLHASCQGRTDEDFKEKIGYSQSLFEDLTVTDPTGLGEHSGESKPYPLFIRNGPGEILATLHNLDQAFQRPDLFGAETLRFDTFTNELLLDGQPLTDGMVVDIRLRLQRLGFKPIGRELIRDALVRHGEQPEHRYDAAIEWLEGLSWDGKPRIETFWSTYFGVEDTPYSRSVGLYAWTALAGRVMEPGVQADMAVVLRGPQGIGKSQGIKLMAPWPEAFTEVSFSMKDEDLSRAMQGRVVVELAELKGLASRDAEAIKAWITKQREEWVPKYMERRVSYPRRCLLLGSTNEAGFLDDDTGERRWLPMTVERPIDREAVERDREQLWAEARATFEMAGIVWRGAEKLAVAEHAEYRRRDVWEEVVEQWLQQPWTVDDLTPAAVGVLQLGEVAEGALGITASRLSMGDQKRLGKVLRGLGWKLVATKVDGKTAKRWVKG